MTKTNEVYECCNSCGRLAHDVHAAVYKIRRPMAECSTYHEATCPLCGTKAAVTELRDFGYPDLTLINWRSLRRAIKEMKQGKR